MENRMIKEVKLEKKHYETPELVEMTEMSFPKEVWNKFCQNKWCFGCTNCTCR